MIALRPALLLGLPQPYAHLLVSHVDSGRREPRVPDRLTTTNQAFASPSFVVAETVPRCAQVEDVSVGVSFACSSYSLLMSTLAHVLRGVARSSAL